MVCNTSKGVLIRITPVAQRKRVGLLIQRLWVRVPSGVKQFFFFLSNTLLIRNAFRYHNLCYVFPFILQLAHSYFCKTSVLQESEVIDGLPKSADFSTSLLQSLLQCQTQSLSLYLQPCIESRCHHHHS